MAFNLSCPPLQAGHVSSQPRVRPKLLASASPQRLHRPFVNYLPLARPSALCIRCSASRSDGGDEDGAVKEVERLLEKKRRAELASRIASGEFTVQQPGYFSLSPFFPP